VEAKTGQLDEEVDSIFVVAEKCSDGLLWFETHGEKTLPRGIVGREQALQSLKFRVNLSVPPFV
jgi:hypothetical protein